MATWRKPARQPAAGLAPASERGEHWWPVATAIIAVAGLHVALPGRYRVQPAWVVPVVLLALLAVLISPGTRAGSTGSELGCGPSPAWSSRLSLWRACWPPSGWWWTS
jgi:hypothetical protein